MPKMKFNTRIKYKGTVHKGLEPFEVDDADVKELQHRGGVLIVEKEHDKPKALEPEKTPDENQKPKGKEKSRRG